VSSQSANGDRGSPAACASGFAQGSEIGKAGAGNKPGSVEDNHSSRTTVTGRLQQPTRESARDRRLAKLCSSPIGEVALRRTPLFGLAPGGVYRAADCYQPRGALLPHLFTLTGLAPGGLFSVALSMGSRPPGVTWRPVRRSPDFPLLLWSSDCLADSGVSGPRIL